MIYLQTTDYNEIVKEVKNGNEQVVASLYKTCYPMVHSLILKNGRYIDEVEEILQEGIVIFYENVIKPDFSLTCKPSTYIYSICRNLLLKSIQKGVRWVELDYDYLNNIEEEMAAAEEESFNEKERLMYELLNTVGESCKKILELFYFKKLSLEEIANKLAYANTQTAKTQKYKCLQKMKKSINK